MNKQIIIKNTILLLILGLLCGTVATASAAPANITSLSATVTSSQIVINGFSSDNGTVVLNSEFSTNVTVAGDKTFEYTRNGYKVPNLGGDETLTISTYPVESNSTLTIGKTILIWNVDIVNTTILTIPSKLAAYTSPNFNKSAIYINDQFFGGLNASKYLVGKTLNIKINGTSNAPEVTIKFTGTRTINANGSFSTAIDTAGFPDGTYTITANGGITSGTNMTTTTLPYTAPPAPPSGGGSGGTGGPLDIISGSDDTPPAEPSEPTEEPGVTEPEETDDAPKEPIKTDDPETTFPTEEPDSSGIFDKLGIFLLALVGMLVVVYMVRKYKK